VDDVSVHSWNVIIQPKPWHQITPTVPLLFVITYDEVRDVAPSAGEATIRKNESQVHLTNHPDQTRVLPAGVCAVREEAFKRASDACEVQDVDGDWGYLSSMQMSIESNRGL
jgi:hypothetical protein